MNARARGSPFKKDGSLPPAKNASLVSQKIWVSALNGELIMGSGIDADRPRRRTGQSK